ncbi:MAG: hypothetical protein IJR30_06110, partial [Prevotella sp.]|nr:hypothetical protein [Prevotella sp.]
LGMAYASIALPSLVRQFGMAYASMLCSRFSDNFPLPSAIIVRLSANHVNLLALASPIIFHYQLPYAVI